MSRQRQSTLVPAVSDPLEPTHHSTLLASSLQSDGELMSSNVKEKGDKIVFLTKFVNFVESVAGKQIDVIPANVVSGLEAERTRYMLQLFCAIATNHASLTNNGKAPLSSGSDPEDETTTCDENTPDNEGGVPEAGGDCAGGECEGGEVEKVACEERPSLYSAEITCYPDHFPPFISAEQPGGARPVPCTSNAEIVVDGQLFVQQPAQKCREGHLQPDALPTEPTDNVIRSLAYALPRSIETFASLLSNIEDELSEPSMGFVDATR